MLIYVALAAVFVALIYFWLTKDYDYWRKQGIPYVEPRFLVGNMGPTITMSTSLGQLMTDIYRKYQSHPCVGVFNMRNPALLVRDLEVIRTVLVSEFSKFHDIPIVIDEDVDPVLAKNPFFLRGERWKIVRGQLTPLLTVAKMKAMFPLVQETCKNMVTYLSDEVKAAGQDGLDTKELSLKFTTDNVASCAFGLEGKAFSDPNAEFRKMAEKFMKPSALGMLRFFFVTVFPELSKVFRVPLSDKAISDKFKEIISATIKYRLENKVVRNDFLDSIIELKSKKMPFEYTEDYIVAHCMTFFLDGSETSSLVMSFALFELAVNPDIQERLRKEIDSVLAKHNGALTFEAIQEMAYLDAVFQETLRKYPPLTVMTRLCTENYKITTPDGREASVAKDQEVLVPTFAIHRDPQYYPDPERFDPDRFTPEAKHPLPKNCFFGFGDGPRTCLGQRFANMQLKAGLVTLVSNFDIKAGKKTKIPLELDSMFFLLTVKNGIWLNFYKRK